MQYNKRADLITIGQWLESKICFGSFEEPFTSDKKYEEIGNEFVKYMLGFAEYDLLYNHHPDLFNYRIHHTMILQREVAKNL